MSDAHDPVWSKISLTTTFRIFVPDIILKCLLVLLILYLLTFYEASIKKIECGPMYNVMAALPNCSTPQSLAHAHYLTAVQ